MGSQIAIDARQWIAAEQRELMHPGELVPQLLELKGRVQRTAGSHNPTISPKMRTGSPREAA